MASLLAVHPSSVMPPGEWLAQLLHDAARSQMTVHRLAGKAADCTAGSRRSCVLSRRPLHRLISWKPGSWTLVHFERLMLVLGVLLSQVTVRALSVACSLSECSFPKASVRGCVLTLKDSCV